MLTVVKTLPNTALQFYVYDSAKDLLLATFHHGDCQEATDDLSQVYNLLQSLHCRCPMLICSQVCSV